MRDSRKMRDARKIFGPYLHFIAYDSVVILKTDINETDDLLFSSEHITAVC